MSTVDANKTKSGSFGLTYPTLSRENYTAWALKMKVYMQAQGVWSAVEEKTDPKVVVEEKTDKIAMAMLYQGIPEEVLLSVADKKTAKETWEAIQTLCQGAEKVKKARVQTLKAEFESLSMKETEGLDDFYMKLNGLVTNIRALGEEMKESYVVKRLLRSVPQRFLQITSTIEQFGDLETMSVEEAIGSLKAHEERIKGKTETGEARLMLTEEEWRKRDSEEGKLLFTREEWLKRSGKGGTEGQNSGFRTRGGQDRSKIRCFNCNLHGHYARECKKPRRYNEQRQEANLTRMNDDEPALLLAEHTKEKAQLLILDEGKVKPMLKKEPNGIQGESNLWYLDNGASNHMSGEKSKFSTLNEGVSGQVKFGDGSSVEIKGKGSIIFNCKNGEERTLSDVYFIPSLRSNIISLGQLTEEGNQVTIKGDYMWVHERDGRLLMKVKRSANRLYKLIIESAKPRCLLSRTEEDSKLWHARLGHVNYQAMSLMFKENMVKGFPKVVQPKDVCVGCLQSKQTRKQMPTKSNFCAAKVLELVHGDLCGPITPATAAGNRYVFLLVDDYSRAMWIYFLKSKNEAFDAFKKFKALVETGERKIETFRTDRGGEFTSHEFKLFCEENGIKRHYTAPYTPQQNGVVERRNRTVMEMARSLLKEMKLPTKFWGEAVRHAVYVLNRLPTRALTGVTPYEAWTERKPDISHFRVFGCVSHMKIPSQLTTKLDDRSVRVINLGKEPGSKAYRLYNPKEDRIYVSKDVMFEEKKAWTWNETDSGDSEKMSTFTIEDVQLEEVINEGENQGTDDDSVTQPENPESPVSQFSTGGSQSSTGIQSSFGTQSELRSENYDDSAIPKKSRRLSDIYNDTEEVVLDEELYLMGVEEPANYKEAVKDMNWRRAMDAEIESIEKNGTWSLVELPSEQKEIGLKWIFKLKRDATGKVTKYKARLVAKGYAQEHGIDYEEVYAPVTRLETVRLLLALAAKRSWQVHHLDVKTAFLNGEITEDVYVSQPEGYKKLGSEHLVYKLSKALYGLRQAPRAWYAKLNQCLVSLGFKRCPYENAVYTKGEGSDSLVIAVYVDDILVTGANVAKIEEFKTEMAGKFEMTDLGRLSYYLGIEVEQNQGNIVLKQSSYAKKILEKAGMKDCNPTRYPMDPKEQISKDEMGKTVDTTMYKSLVGSLRYLVNTRPDIAYAVGVVSRYMERPTVLHLSAVKRILRYLKGTLHFGLVYTEKGGNNAISGFSDSDMGGTVDDRKSTGGMAYYLNESLVSWVSQKQRCVALSTCEAELMAATAAACQGIWLRNVLSQITSEFVEPITLFIDNRSALDLAKNPVFNGRSKHIDIRYHFIRECVERGEVIIKHVSSDLQRADSLTKAMTTVKFERMRSLLGVQQLDKDYEIKGGIVG